MEQMAAIQSTHPAVPEGCPQQELDRYPPGRMSREQIRCRIDEIDLQLLALLEERMELGLRVRRFKTGPTDSGREQVVRRRAMGSSLALVEPNFAGNLFGNIIGESKRLQENGHRLVAFQGEHGAYSEVAARSLVPDSAYLPCLGFPDIFTGVEQAYYDIGVVPVESSLGGAVTEVNELLAASRLHVVGELSLPVHHCLLCHEQTDPRSVRVVYSHPRALAQCHAFLSHHGIEARPFYDTAGAASMLARDKPRATAAIASNLAAELFGLRIIAEHIEDDPANSTRFLLLSRTPAAQGDKCSVVFLTAHQAGRLYEVLQLFAEAGINLSRIASMPLRNDPGSYCFFLDLQGSDRDPAVRQALEQARQRTRSLRLLGCYPACAES